MDIGSAKIRPEEMQSVPHYLIACLEPDEEFHVMRFQQMAKEALKNMNAHDWFMFEWIASRSYANDYSELDFDHLNTFDIDIK